MVERINKIHQQFFGTRASDPEALFNAFHRYQAGLSRLARQEDNILDPEIQNIVREMSSRGGLTYADLTHIALILDGGEEGKCSQRWQRVLEKCCPE